MNIMNLKLNKFQLLIMLILFIGIVMTVILVQKQQILKGRADTGSNIEFLGSGVTQGNPPIARTQSIQLRLLYNQSSSGTPPPPPPPPNSANTCFFNLPDGQTISGNVPVTITANRPDLSNYLSLQIANPGTNSFQVLSSQADILFANMSTYSLFQNGPAILECRIQTDPEGGTIIFSSFITVNVQN